MTDVKQLITEHLDIWLTAETEKKSGRGRSSGSSDTIYGVQKLRELILELAFLGKLVSNSNDVCNFKQKIINEQKELIKDEVLKKTTNIDVLENSEFAYSLPCTWSLLRLADAGYNLGQKTPDSKFSYIDVSAINSIFGRVENPTILSADEPPSRARKKVKLGTVIYSTIRPYLNNIAVIDQSFDHEPIASTAFAVIHPYKVINSHYLFYYLRSPLFVEYVESQQIGIAYPAINDKQFFSGLLPVPPLEEQQRIVEKVDELMQLCDQLEQQQTLSSDAHATLVDTLLKALTESSDADEFQDNWQRIVANFDVLFTTEHSIEQLKQTVLQLAVMGKLVKQDPSDEPASELLKKIVDEKTKLIKEGKIKKTKPLPEIDEDEKPFELPSGWEFARLSNVLDVRDGTHDSPRDYKGDDFRYLVTSKNFENGNINFETARKISVKDYEEIIKRSNVEEDDILFSMIGGNIGNQLMVKGFSEFAIKNVALFKYFNKLATYPYFIKLFTSYIAIDLQEKALGGAQPFVGLGTLRELIIGLPPINEQKCIVEKVDQLFSIIDQLQVLQSKLQKTKLHLADALVLNAVERV